MSVQAGVWRFERAPGSESLLKVNEPFQGHAQPESGTQPYLCESGREITWQGRLDNKEDLLSQLGKNSIEIHSDVALIAAAVERWGEQTFSKLKGDWTVAIWDPQQKELVLARDFIGVRQLFYWLSHNIIVWSSDLACLVSCGAGFSLSDEYVAGYFTVWPRAHLSPYREIKAVPPGHFIRIQRGKEILGAYWTLDNRTGIRYATDAEYEEHFRYLFRQAVQRRLSVNSPILAELSGGLDSSSIVCMADEICATTGDVPRVDTFSYFDPQEPDDDDCSYFTRVEELRKQRGHHLEIRGEGDSFLCLPSETAAAPSFTGRREIDTTLAELVKKYGYKVVLSGTGGDELMGQALDPRVQFADLMVQGKIVSLWKQMTEWSMLIRRPWIQLLCESFAMLLPIAVRTRIPRARNVEAWMGRKFSSDHSLAARLLTAAEGGWCRIPSRRDSLQTLSTLSGQLTCGTPFCAERSYPYLDQDLVEFLSLIPTEQLVRPGERRSLMRRALRSLLPKEILERRTKSAEARCYAVTLNKHWREIEPLLSSPRIAELGYVEAKEFRRALLAMKHGQMSPHYVRLLRALSLEIWLRDAEHRGTIAGSRSACTGPHLRDALRLWMELPDRATFAGFKKFC